MQHPSTNDRLRPDVSTGILPNSARAAPGIAVPKVPGDRNFSQTLSKAKAETTGRTRLKIAAGAGESASHSDR